MNEGEHGERLRAVYAIALAPRGIAFGVGQKIPCCLRVHHALLLCAPTYL